MTKSNVRIFALLLGLLIIAPLRPHATVAAAAEAKVEEQTLSSDGRWIGAAISPRGVHVAVLALRGSRNVVLIDGVEGPTFDALVDRNGQTYFPGSSDLVLWGPGSGSIVFSDDGVHCAYLGKVGSQYIEVLDGKEIYRGGFGGSLQRLEFSASGKHVAYVETEAGFARRRVVMDGKPEPWSYDEPHVVFSPDGAHYAYFGTQPDGTHAPWSVVDGRQVQFFGGNLEFTATGHLMSVLQANGLETLTMDSKPVMRATRIGPVWVAPVGGMVAAVMLPKEGVPSMLTINGKVIPGTEGVEVKGVYFSPDGKRYAAHCKTATYGEFMLTDGKKGQEYQAVEDTLGIGGGPVFSADSSKLLYVALNSGKSFVIAGDVESEGFEWISPPVIGANGRFAYGFRDLQKYEVVVDGKVLAPARRSDAMQFAFSSDGAHYAFATDRGAFDTALVVDGNEVPGVALYVLRGQERDFPAFRFSPDGKHIIYFGRDVRVSTVRGFWMDRKFVFPDDNNDMGRVRFSPDSQHIMWIASDPGTATNTVVVDGRPSVKFRESALDQMPEASEMGADGALTFLAIKGGALVRYRVTPPLDTSIATLLAGAK